jgi:hypothetical protein
MHMQTTIPSDAERLELERLFTERFPRAPVPTIQLVAGPNPRRALFRHGNNPAVAAAEECRDGWKLLADVPNEYRD